MAEGRADWFEDSLFNMLVDYYPEVPFRPYGSGATAQNVLPVLRDLRLGCIIVYAKGHSGVTTFPSSLGTEHAMLARDMPRAFRAYTRETGTRLFLYYSGQLDGVAGTRHPEWRMLGRHGEPLQYFKEFQGFNCFGNCPLSAYFDEWVAVHVRELIGRYEPDGFWVDGDWAGPCYCPRCEARFRKETGLAGPMPEHSPATPEGRAWMAIWSGIMHEWRMRWSALVKSLKGDCMYSAGNVSARTEYLAPFDWRSGDWFSPNNHRLHMSMSARRYATTGLPYDAYTCDTSFVHSRADMSSRTKTLHRMLQEGATLLANGAQWGYWTYPSGDGALVPSRMRMARRAADFARERRGVCLHTTFVPETVILNTALGAYLATELSAGIMGAGKALIALHRSPVTVDEAALRGALDYELAVLPETPGIRPEDVRRLEAFVRSGGRFLSTGESPVESPELQSLLGISLEKRGELDEGHLFRTSGDPTGVHASWDRYRLVEARELCPLYHSWDHLNPKAPLLMANWPMHGQVDEVHPERAGMPAATVRELGSGMAVHIPTAVFSQYWKYGNPDQLDWVREILHFMLRDPFFSTDAPSCVEVSLRARGDTLLVHLVNGNPGRDLSLVGTEDWWVDDVPPIGPITCRIRSETRPGAVRLEPGAEEPAWSWERGVIIVTVSRLHIHACLVVEPWSKPAASPSSYIRGDGKSDPIGGRT